MRGDVRLVVLVQCHFAAIEKRRVVSVRVSLAQRAAAAAARNSRLHALVVARLIGEDARVTRDCLAAQHRVEPVVVESDVSVVAAYARALLLEHF